MNKQSTTLIKVVHVHLLYEKDPSRKNFYFGSIAAIFTRLTPEDIGITQSSLQHAGLRPGGQKLTRRALITIAHLIRT